MPWIRIVYIPLSVLVACSAAPAQSSSRPTTARLDRTDARYWISRAADSYLHDAPKGTDVEWLIEALAYAGDDARLRKLIERWAQRVHGAPAPLAAMGYATVAYGYARLGDGEAYAAAAAQATALVQDADDTFGRGVELELTRAAAALGEFQRVRETVEHTEDPQRKGRLLIAAAYTSFRAGHTDVGRGFLSHATRIADRIQDAEARKRVIRSIWRAQVELGELDAAVATVDEHADPADAVSVCATIADGNHRRNPRRYRTYARMAIERALAAEQPLPIDTLADVMRVAASDRQLIRATTKLVPLAERAAADDEKARWHLAQMYAYAGDFDACRRELDRLREIAVAADETSVHLIVMELDSLAFALAFAGDVATAESLADWVNDQDHKSEVFKAIGIGHAVAGRIDRAIGMLERPALRDVSRQIIVAAIAKELARMGRLKHLEEWADALATPQLRRTAYRGAAEGLADRWFLEHIMLLLW